MCGVPCCATMRTNRSRAEKEIEALPQISTGQDLSGHKHCQDLANPPKLEAFIEIISEKRLDHLFAPRFCSLIEIRKGLEGQKPS